MKKLLGILAIGLLLCNKGFSVESLKENQKGKIKFQSIPTITLNQFLRGESGEQTIEISAKLKFPKKKWTERLPAVVLLHGGGGPRAGVKYWSKILNKIGLATFVVDSNSTRGCPPSTKGVCENYSQHQGMANIVDAYRALEILSTHPLIDPERIAVLHAIFLLTTMKKSVIGLFEFFMVNWMNGQLLYLVKIMLIDYVK